MDAQRPPQEYVDHLNDLNAASHIVHLLHEIRSLGQSIWADFCPSDGSDIIARIIEFPTQYMKSSRNADVRTTAEEYPAYLIRYYESVVEHLQTVQNKEKIVNAMRETCHLNPKLFDPSLAGRPSQKEHIEFIAARAGLLPDEVSYLALLLESFVWATVLWKLFLEPGWHYAEQLMEDVIEHLLSHPIVLVLAIQVWGLLR
ncbi:MAG: hypothetical protein Q9209_007475 [Squamulea sp. 1 TL-2023]